MLAFDVLVRGRLTEAVGGLNVVVPQGRSKAQACNGGVSLAWTTEAGQRGSLELSAQRFEEHLEAGVILILDSAQICSPLETPWRVGSAG